MEQANNIATFGIKACNVGSLEPIAVGASQSEILVLSWATVLARDDVIDLKRYRVESRWQTTVFTAGTGSLPNPTDKFGIQGAQLLGRALQRASRLGLHGSNEIAHM